MEPIPESLNADRGLGPDVVGGIAAALAQLSAERDVRSSLTLQMFTDGQVRNRQYVRRHRRCIRGHHQCQCLAEILGDWAPAAVTNADVSKQRIAGAAQRPGISGHQFAEALSRLAQW